MVFTEMQGFIYKNKNGIVCVCVMEMQVIW